jgi:squalene-hopene/tetraprenyl-beta-curcumene cyclase
VSNVVDHERMRANAIERLLSARNAAGHWEGELSSSALSTATAALALDLASRTAQRGIDADRRLAARARAWLRAHQNADGGFGDTPASPSNLATTALAWAVLGLDASAWDAGPMRRAEARLFAFTGSLEPEALTRALLRAYGDDRTFSVPILVVCALAGRLGEGREAWARLPVIPFELAALPHGFFRLLGLPMVSYALPALIAIGHVQHAHCPRRNPLTRFARNLARERTLRTLARIQPASGGYLEATPLTSFVVASLVRSGRGEHPVVAAGLRFLRASARADGSWPIDTNLATWLTSLAIDALAGTSEGDVERDIHAELSPARAWLLGQQHRSVHPYTHAAPGGWAWTDRPGGVPDADDTAGALLALARLGREEPGVREAAALGVRWLADLQNKGGGIPTFCRGWSGLPFDRSCADLTAHALRAFAAWDDALDGIARARARSAARRAAAFLVRGQRADGAWVPLWFGSQQVPSLANPLYGTARVLAASAELVRAGAGSTVARAEEWLLASQQAHGGFGAERGVTATIEETALALGALAGAAARGNAAALPALRRAADWLSGRTGGGTSFAAAPIGLYFAKLWYSEALYPLIFTVSALQRARRFLAPASGAALRS